jgi:putative PIN family toxin of toxin-antitoxin system
MYVVIDTNVLVSAFWARNSNPATILSMVLHKNIIPCTDHRILGEYREVLLRPKFNFEKREVEDILRLILDEGMSVIAPPLSLSFADESDKKFFEVAMQMDAILITGNEKHYPKHKNIKSPATFLEELGL